MTGSIVDWQTVYKMPSRHLWTKWNPLSASLVVIGDQNSTPLTICEVSTLYVRNIAEGWC